MKPHAENGRGGPVVNMEMENLLREIWDQLSRGGEAGRG